MRALLPAGFCLALLLPLYAQTQPNPFDTAEGRAQGAALFQTHCAYCHGARGEGGRGADLTTGNYRRGGSDAELYATIRNGIPGTEMPTVRATGDEVWKMAAFVKSLGAAGLRETANGDARAGKAVYEGKGGCVACHAIAGSGGDLGPDLSAIGRSRGVSHLKESLLNPDADVSVSYRAVQLVTRSGQTVGGIRLNEDDLSIQLRDPTNHLRSFFKNTLQEIRRDKPSLMPAYGKLLSSTELENLVAYLSSMRGSQ